MVALPNASSVAIALGTRCDGLAAKVMRGNPSRCALFGNQRLDPHNITIAHDTHAAYVSMHMKLQESPALDDNDNVHPSTIFQRDEHMALALCQMLLSFSHQCMRSAQTGEASDDDDDDENNTSSDSFTRRRSSSSRPLTALQRDCTRRRSATTKRSFPKRHLGMKPSLDADGLIKC